MCSVIIKGVRSIAYVNWILLLWFDICMILFAIYHPMHCTSVAIYVGIGPVGGFVGRQMSGHFCVTSNHLQIVLSDYNYIIYI